MPYTNLILTAGISSFASRNIFGVRFREPGSPLTFPNGQQNPVAADKILTDDALQQACREWASPLLLQQLDPSAISAEFSVLHAIVRQGKGLSPGAVVHLVHTPTLGGRLAVILQQELLSSLLGIQLHPVELSIPFDPSQPGGLALASGSFIGQISRLLQGNDPRQAAFAPIGGYKSMVALGHTAASFHGFPSLYLHEDSQVLQEIAPAPVSISPQVRAAVGATALRIGNGADLHQLNEEERRIVDAHTSFFTRIDDLVELNELGQYLRLNELPVLLSPQAVTAYREDQHLLRNQIFQIRDIAVVDPDHKGINHDLTSTHGRNHPWRLARMGQGIRIVWQTTRETLLIQQIWRNHDQYEKEAAGVVTQSLPAALTGFRSLSEI